MKLVLLYLTLVLAISAPVFGAFDHVFVVIFENEDHLSALADPNFAALLPKGLLLDNYFSVTHPSQPNYIALVAGDTLGVTTDGNYNLTANFLVDLLETNGKTWKSYQQNYPGDCFLGTASADSLYTRKHNPFISFTSVSEDPKGRCANIVVDTQLQTDIAANALPNYMFFTPNMKNNGHDTTITYAGTWMASFLPPLLSDATFMNNTLVVVTFDEGETSSSPANNKVFTLLIGNGIPQGQKTSIRYDHYSLLRTIQDNFGVGNLGRNDATATPINFNSVDPPGATPIQTSSPTSSAPTAKVASSVARVDLISFVLLSVTLVSLL